MTMDDCVSRMHGVRMLLGAIGAALILYVAFAVRHGQYTVRGKQVDRSEQPFSFWLGLLLLLGLGALILAVAAGAVADPMLDCG